MSATCSRCRGTDHLISGDGPTICGPCIDLLTQAAADPYTASPRLRDALAELHSDVLTLTETESGRPEWAWLTR